jgi:phosphate-selective porin OprO/OprP
VAFSFQEYHPSTKIMYSCTQKRLPFFLLVLFLAANSALAQDNAKEQLDPSHTQTEVLNSAQPDSETQNTQKEKNADVREAVLENLDLQVMVEESFDSEDISAPPDDGQPSKEGDVLPPDENQEEWYDRFTPIVEKMQDIPYLSERGWLHFGRIEFEYGHFSKSELLDGDSGFNFRSLRSGIIKLFDSGTIVKLDIDLTDGDSNFTDMYARFTTKLGLFTLGNQKVALSLVNQTSRLAQTFMEEPLPAEAFGLVRRLGMGWDFHRKKVGVHLTAFGPDLNERIGKFGYGARLYTNPTRTRWSLAHIGVSGVRETMDHDARFRARPETRVTDTFLVDTREDADVEKQAILSLEMALAHKSLSIRGEYFYTEWQRKIQKDTNFSGYYLQAAWVITGESFQYKQGRFLRIRPDSSKGAWEVALRYSAIDLNDQDVLGGAEKNTTLALNWYGPGNQMRIQTNLIRARAETVTGKEDPLILQVRAQFHW